MSPSEIKRENPANIVVKSLLYPLGVNIYIYIYVEII
jgi:hypothetical protein